MLSVPRNAIKPKIADPNSGAPKIARHVAPSPDVPFILHGATVSAGAQIVYRHFPTSRKWPPVNMDPMWCQRLRPGRLLFHNSIGEECAATGKLQMQLPTPLDSQSNVRVRGDPGTERHRDSERGYRAYIVSAFCPTLMLGGLTLLRQTCMPLDFFLI